MQPRLQPPVYENEPWSFLSCLGQCKCSYDGYFVISESRPVYYTLQMEVLTCSRLPSGRSKSHSCLYCIYETFRLFFEGYYYSRPCSTMNKLPLVTPSALTATALTHLFRQVSDSMSGRFLGHARCLRNVRQPVAPCTYQHLEENPALSYHTNY